MEGCYKTFPCEIYRRGVKVIIGDIEFLNNTLDEDNMSKFKLSPDDEEVERTNAYTFMNPDGSSVIYLKKAPEEPHELQTLAHEIYHAVTNIMEEVGVIHTKESDEAWAYLYEHLFFEITNFCYFNDPYE